MLIGTSTVNESELVLRVLQDWCSPAFRPLAARVQLLNAKPENVRLEAQVGTGAAQLLCNYLGTYCWGHRTMWVLVGIMRLGTLLCHVASVMRKGLIVTAPLSACCLCPVVGCCTGGTALLCDDRH